MNGSIFKENTKDPFYFVTQFQNFWRHEKQRKQQRVRAERHFRPGDVWVLVSEDIICLSACLSVHTYYRSLGWGFSRHYLGARSSPAPRSGARESGRPSGTGDGQTHRPVLQLSGVFAVSSSSVSHEVHQVCVSLRLQGGLTEDPLSTKQRGGGGVYCYFFEHSERKSSSNFPQTVQQFIPTESKALNFSNELG